MTHRIFTRLFIISLLLFTHYLLLAQAKPAKPTTAAAKVKQAPVKSFLGKYTGIKNVCSAEQAKVLAALPLIIKDDKGELYKISSYQLGYKRVGITEDEETGKTSPQSDLVAQRFTKTPLPDIWRTNIVEQIHTGEELFFFDIIVFNKQGRLLFAPDLKISIE